MVNNKTANQSQVSYDIETHIKAAAEHRALYRLMSEAMVPLDLDDMVGYANQVRVQRMLGRYTQHANHALGNIIAYGYSLGEEGILDYLNQLEEEADRKISICMDSQEQFNNN